MNARAQTSTFRVWGIVGVVMLASYVFSPGLVAWLHAKRCTPSGVDGALIEFYRPLAWVAEQTGQSSRMNAYVEECALRGWPEKEGSYTPLFMFLFAPKEEMSWPEGVAGQAAEDLAGY